MPSASHTFRRIDHQWITMADGTRLSGRLWLPADAASHPVPAILEAVPYRKGDLTAPADARWHSHLARGGYACLRLDIRGSGDSEGRLHDEYLPQEQDDNVEVIRWLAAQPWCSGKVGMIGYSWGGFAALQTAARRPPELGAIVSHCSTDDRYLGDCHWMGGCLLASDMLKWATWMLVFGALPPDPLVFGSGWRDAWIDRLRDVSPLAETWLSHPLADGYWMQGSVGATPEAIHCPVLATGGWADPYVDTVFRLLSSLHVPVHGIVGPWSHTWPDVGWPGPAVGYWDQVLLWFDRWLKDQPNPVDTWPPLRAYLQDSRPPDSAEVVVPGNWLALEGPGELSIAEVLADESEPLTVPAHPHTGIGAGVWCPSGRPGELPGDQGADDARSLCFDLPAATRDDALLGIPRLRLRLRSGRPRALVAARLCDVAPDGRSLLVSWGLLNLSHADGHTRVVDRPPGVWFPVELPLRATGHRLPAGHHWRLALSASYWPHAWPSPVEPLLELDAYGLRLELPRLTAAQLAAVWPDGGFGAPATPEGMDLRQLRPPTWRRDVRTSAAGGISIRDRTDSGAWSAADGVHAAERALDRYRLLADTGAQAEVIAWREVVVGRTGWQARVLASSRLSAAADSDAFQLTSRVQAFEGRTLIWDHSRRRQVPRHGI